MGLNLGANYDYNTEQQGLDQRRQLMMAMQSGALQPMQLGPAPGGVMPKMSPLSAMAPMIQALLASKVGKDVEADQKSLQDRYKTDLVNGMQQYMTTMQGKPAEQLPPDVQGPTQPGVAPDPRKAVLEAIASNHPVLQQFGMSQMAQMGKGQVQAKDLLPYVQPSAIPALLSKGVDGFVPKKDIKEAGGTFYDVGGDVPTALGGKTFAEPVMINGDLYQTDRDSGKLVKLDNAPKVTVGGQQVMVDAAKKKGMEFYWENAAKKVNALGEAATTAQNNLQTLAELRNLDKQGIFSNVTSGPSTFLASLGQSLGMDVDTSKLGNTEAYNALTNDLWQGLVSKYGGNRGVTQEEAAQIKKMLPLASSSPEARGQLFSILENVSNRQMVQYQRANRAYAKATKMDDPEVFAEEFGDIYNPTPNTPSPVTPPTAPRKQGSNAPMSLDDYLKSRMGGR